MLTSITSFIKLSYRRQTGKQKGIKYSLCTITRLSSSSLWPFSLEYLIQKENQKIIKKVREWSEPLRIYFFSLLMYMIKEKLIKVSIILIYSHSVHDTNIHYFVETPASFYVLPLTVGFLELHHTWDMDGQAFSVVWVFLQYPVQRGKSF